MGLADRRRVAALIGQHPHMNVATCARRYGGLLDTAASNYAGHIGGQTRPTVPFTPPPAVIATMAGPRNNAVHKRGALACA